MRIQLHDGEHLTLERARGARLASIGGNAWITVERDARDVLILPGDYFIVPSDRSVLVGPLAGTVTLEVQGARDARSGVPTHKRGPIAMDYGGHRGCGAVLAVAGIAWRGLALLLRRGTALLTDAYRPEKKGDGAGNERFSDLCNSRQPN